MVWDNATYGNHCKLRLETCGLHTEHVYDVRTNGDRAIFDCDLVCYGLLLFQGWQCLNYIICSFSNHAFIVTIFVWKVVSLPYYHSHTYCRYIVWCITVWPDKYSSIIFTYRTWRWHDRSWGGMQFLIFFRSCSKWSFIKRNVGIDVSLSQKRIILYAIYMYRVLVESYEMCAEGRHMDATRKW